MLIGAILYCLGNNAPSWTFSLIAVSSYPLNIFSFLLVVEAVDVDYYLYHGVSIHELNECFL